MEFQYVKALHIIFVVAWFSALFYIVRLFIYNREAQDKDPIARPILTAQFQIMQRKLWYMIGWPAMIGSFTFGLWLLFMRPDLLTAPWFWLKLIAVFLLLLYHLECQRILSQQKQGIFKLSSFKLRLFNELATLFLVAIVFLVILKSTSGFIKGTLALFVFAGVLMLTVYLVKKNNKTKEEAKMASKKEDPESSEK